MKTKLPTLIFFVLGALGYMAWAVGPNDTRVLQRNNSNTSNMTRDLPAPANKADAILGFNGTTTRPQYFLLGSGLSITNGVLDSSSDSKESIGLGNVDNTADVDKPVSTSQQSALDAKADTSSLKPVATSGSYNDLLNKPVIPPEQVNSDWNSASGLSQILNKPNLASVATTGSYSDLSNRPVIPNAQVASDWSATSGPSFIQNKPTLASVATSGSYSDLTGKPTNVSSFTNDASYVTATALTASLGSYATTAAVTTTLNGYATSTALTSGLAGKFNQPTGTTSQYIRGDGSLATFPTAQARAFNNTPGRSIVTVAAAANGFQPDASRDTLVNYSITINTTSSVTGGSAGYVVLEISPTNSATAANWVEVSRMAAGQMNGLVVGLTLNHTTTGNVTAMVPAGSFARLRSVQLTAVSATFAVPSAQEVKF